MRPALLAAALCLASALPAAVSAKTLGRLEATIGGRHISYRVTDAPDAGSGWVMPANDAPATRQHLSILWKGKTPTDLLVMEMVIVDGKPVSGRLLLPEARQGALEAEMPATLSITLDRVKVDGPWLKIAGRLKGRFYPLRSNGKLLPEDGVTLSAHFDSWVPGIAPPSAAKPAKAKSQAPERSKRPHLRDDTKK